MHTSFVGGPVERVELGEFEVISGSIDVSDPCYEKSHRCRHVIDNARRGRWRAWSVFLGDELFQLEVSHESDESGADDIFVLASNVIGVDSGMAGFFDSAHFRDDGVAPRHRTFPGFDPCYDGSPGDRWYNHCWWTVAAKERAEPWRRGAGVTPYGAVSATAFGDGTYEVHVRHVDGLTVAAVLTFFYDEAGVDSDGGGEYWGRRDGAPACACPLCHGECGGTAVGIWRGAVVCRGCAEPFDGRCRELRCRPCRRDLIGLVKGKDYGRV